MLGVDFAQFSSVPTPAQIDCWRHEGVGYAMVGIGSTPDGWADHLNRDKRGPQMDAVAAGGIRLEVWPYLIWDIAEWQTEEALRAVEGFPVRIFWLDCEDAPRGRSAAQLGGIINRCVEMVTAAGFETGIYTGGWWWEPNMGTSEGWRHLRLWLAHYAAEPGSLTQSMGWPLHTHQYRGTVEHCGLNVDLNWRLVAAEEDDLSTPEALLRALRACNQQQLNEVWQILQEANVPIAFIDPADHPKRRQLDNDQFWEPIRRDQAIADAVTAAVQAHEGDHD